MSQQFPEQNWATIQRVILPADGQVDALPLYVDAGTVSGLRFIENDELARTPKRREDKLQLISSGTSEAHAEDILDRFSMTVRHGDRLSFGTYFNAFPASYWRRWTTLESVRLQVNTRGTGAVIVYRSNARGALQRVDSRRVEGSQETVFDLSLAPFGDGGWYWFDLASGAEDLVLESAQWQTQREPTRAGSVTIQITTMNKPQFCLNNARLLAANEDVLAAVKEILLVDQGTDKVAEQDGFAEVAASLNGRLRIIDQANLGGSGGFARGMFEAVENGSDYVLLMDDDVVIEPESVLRLTTFAGYCRKPTLVGGHMFDLHNRTVLETYGEVVDANHMHWGPPHADMENRHDLGMTNMRLTRWMHRRVDVDYNAWWMCLVPTSVIKEIGLGLPVFIKWDDVEFGIRAKEAGYQTVSLPGAGLWHVSWGEKDDMVGWQAYFHERNRIIASLLHSPFKKGGRLLGESLKLDVLRVISMQYFTGHVRLMAIEDVFKGPDQLAKDLATKLPEINQAKAHFPDSQFRSDIEEFPAPRLGRALLGTQSASSPSRKQLPSWALKTLARMLLTSPDPQSAERPEAQLAHRDNKWWMLARFDSVIVSNAEGTGASWYRRDRRTMISMLLRAARLHAKLYREWEELTKKYRGSMPELASIESWRRIFDEHTTKVTKYE